MNVQHPHCKQWSSWWRDCSAADATFEVELCKVISKRLQRQFSWEKQGCVFTSLGKNGVIYVFILLLKATKRCYWNQKHWRGGGGGCYSQKRAEYNRHRTVEQISPGSFLKAHRHHVPVPLRFMTPSRSVKDEFFMKGGCKLHTGSFRSWEVARLCHTGTDKPVFHDFCTFEMKGLWIKRGRRGNERFMERTESRKTAGMPDQMGVQEGEARFAPAQWWGRTKRVVNQIFIWASVHSLELHYGTKTAENILEEQLNKNVAYL